MTWVCVFINYLNPFYLFFYSSNLENGAKSVVTGTLYFRKDMSIVELDTIFTTGKMQYNELQLPNNISNFGFSERSINTINNTVVAST